MRRFLPIPSPAMVTAAIALFVALGGSSYAALSSSAAGGCSSGSKIKGSALVNGRTTFPSSFTKISGFNCSGEAIEAKRTGLGRYEVKFSGNSDKSAVGSNVDVPKFGLDNAFVSFTRVGPGDFKVFIYNAVIGGGGPNEDRPFSIVLP
jgi:hypothetical protein